MTGPASPDAADAAQRKGLTPKKGTPTPKRREAEKNLRRPLNAPQTRKEAYKQYRERQRRQAEREREGYARGDERYFRPQDQGPVRAFARDYVDSRRSVSEFFLYFSLAIIVLLFLPFPEFQLGVTYVVWPLMMASIVIEGLFTGSRVKKMAREHFPEESVRGAGMYAAMRQLQIRRLRLPKPRLKPGDDPTPGRR
ncbi:DUF3043 domain-containing protein [Marinitenerispora sediminis]|uniref:DUF3043 domain-containing protein n=1 Tax=Marinitenerispora sediminis TaxID=1931232 RepID=A0A368SZV4_9ACTN|nr:DUF3043 domain-containing protein [Marinitenerispora sediminis]RCV52052.1 DUF3043 domain-containing protein [Marinitenerispora sediminis]RCV54124.1 DUF3043 domain-containing protein [Marinitenerispora sediminis]RCV54365.1 DUF3043 domain-containing protein [Marinitenerispora sediminis]